MSKTKDSNGKLSIRDAMKIADAALHDEYWELTLTGAIGLIEHTGREVQQRYKQYANKHTDREFEVDENNGNVWVVQINENGLHNTSRAFSKPERWIVNRLQEIMEISKDFYRGEFIVQYSPGNGFIGYYSEWSSADTLERALEIASNCHELGWHSKIMKYSGDHYANVEID